MSQLKILDFSPGIKSSDVNHNFETIHEWLKKERHRTAGFGVVEGFDMSIDLITYVMTISSGVYINKSGEEIIVPEKLFNVGPPDSVTFSEELVPDKDGMLLLKFNPYSATNCGNINYSFQSSSSVPLVSEFYLSTADEGVRVPILFVLENKVYVNAVNWENTKINVSYHYSKDRIDSVMLKEDGTYLYQKGIMSTSPSYVNMDEYPGYFAIGLAEWIVGATVSVKFYDTFRSFRSVYVDEDNNLYLNGKLYVESQEIYFIEPVKPKVNDLWYDAKTNSLMIWKEKDGKYGWEAINDMSTVLIREKKTWTESSFPADAQTFLFLEEETNLRFVPGSNELEIIIDNAILMSDQYDEIITENVNYVDNGIGFRLKNQLDRPTCVEVIVNHSVRTSPLRETFQRAAIFVNENFSLWNSLNTSKDFNTEYPYSIGEDQLEVFVGGLRLEPGNEYIETINDLGAVETDRGKMTQTFRVLKNLVSGQKVVYKITKHVWNYDQLDKVVRDIREAAEKAVSDCAAIKEDLVVLNENIQNRFSGIDEDILSIKSNLLNGNDFIKKEDKINSGSLHSELLSKLMKGPISQVSPAASITNIPDVSTEDFIIVFYTSSNISRVLILDIDYSKQVDGDGMRIILSPDLVSVGANIYITGMKFGV